MIENQKAGMDANTCICSKAGCMCGHHNGHSCLMKWLFRIATILIVFCLGYMMGELHGMIRGYGHEAGARGAYSMQGRNMGTMMQQQYDGAGLPTTVAPTTAQ